LWPGQLKVSKIKTPGASKIEEFEVKVYLSSEIEELSHAEWFLTGQC